MYVFSLLLYIYIKNKNKYSIWSQRFFSLLEPRADLLYWGLEGQTICRECTSYTECVTQCARQRSRWISLCTNHPKSLCSSLCILLAWDFSWVNSVSGKHATPSTTRGMHRYLIILTHIKSQTKSLAKIEMEFKHHLRISCKKSKIYQNLFSYICYYKDSTF